ncbi:c-type cytochrome [Mucilaginibacter paludis]|uniref:Cytochrome c class I n=1 Tax=Mucilaginibacter paludis DSM 18603 TaxID=714943 RepID=H1YH65_9SPHI|nr:cytochrome c [Mucilaginibacter paludis]EHQ24567.1 cytochrome c class I [Mucilaginibacter paludis DSM 18603]
MPIIMFFADGHHASAAPCTLVLPLNKPCHSMRASLLNLLPFVAIIIFTACGGSQSTQDAALSTPAPPAAQIVKSESKGVGHFKWVKLDSVSRAQAARGEALFLARCAACHKATGDNTVGPGLKDVTARRTPEWILNQITNPKEMEQKDPISRALLLQHPTGMTMSPVSDAEARQLLDFLRWNDGGVK